MKANFEINLPSIPGKNIKFKIQDIKSASFGTQKARFPDNKALLTKKFVESFHNFHERKVDDQIQTQPESDIAKSQVSERKQLNFRSMIAENRKFLLPVYAQLQKEEAEKTKNSLESKPKGGYSFPKSGSHQPNNQQQEDYDDDTQRAGLTDNYYFTSQNYAKGDNNGSLKQQQAKKPKPSAIFKNETRKRVYDRILNNDVPGPGSYMTDKPQEKKKKGQNRSNENSLKDYKHLKDIIMKVLVEEGQEEEEEVKVKDTKEDHMFVMDDRDRFGNQNFPIAPKLKVPGPGSYEITGTLEDKAKKLLLVEQQRKLLKEWFNN